jgi:hypothetical protein
VTGRDVRFPGLHRGRAAPRDLFTFFTRPHLVILLKLIVRASSFDSVIALQRMALPFSRGYPHDARAHLDGVSTLKRPYDVLLATASLVKRNGAANFNATNRHFHWKGGYPSHGVAAAFNATDCWRLYGASEGCGFVLAAGRGAPQRGAGGEPGTGGTF